MTRGGVFDWFVDPQVLRDTVAAVSNNAFSTSRLETFLRRPSGDSLPVHVTVNQIDGSRNVVVEWVEVEQQTRQDREERALEQAQATKELIRNLAHEIKNPLGGIRGAAQLLEREFPAGVLYPSTVLVERDDGPVTAGDLAGAAQQVRTVDGVASASATGNTSRDGRMATIDVVVEGDPSTKEALGIVPDRRDGVSEIGPGVTALVGGGSATQYDFDNAIESDLRLIAPIALLVIAIILALLLRALIAPLVLIASVIVSFLCTLGISVLFIRYVVGDAGFDASIPTFAFIFLVALGIDYTIFLMGRVREEARKHGTREGMLRALSATGPVITSAGIILAGTFSVLMTLPVTYTFDLGFMVALGILLDTFIVRTIMVPAAVELIGDRIWWPSSAKVAAGLREETGEHPVAEPAEAEAR